MKKVLSLVLIAALLAAMFVGCGGSATSAEVSSAMASEASVVTEASAEDVPAEVPVTASEEVPVEAEDPLKVTFPIEDDVTVTMFTSVNTAITPYIDMENYEDLSMYRGWSEATGVTLDITAVSSDLAKEQFNLMAAADTVTDIVIQGGAWYPGGASAGIKDEVFLNLIEYTDYMPNYLAAIDKYGFRENVMNDEEISAFWQINANNLPFAGVVTRGDLLDKIGTTGNGSLFTRSCLKAGQERSDALLWDQSPLKYAERATTPTLFIAALEDYCCYHVESLQMYSALNRIGVDTRVCLFRHEHHGLSRTGRPEARIRRLQEITGWMDKYLK